MWYDRFQSTRTGAEVKFFLQNNKIYPGFSAVIDRMTGRMENVVEEGKRQCEWRYEATHLVQKRDLWSKRNVNNEDRNFRFINVFVSICGNLSDVQPSIFQPRTEKNL